MKYLMLKIKYGDGQVETVFKKLELWKLKVLIESSGLRRIDFGNARCTYKINTHVKFC